MAGKKYRVRGERQCSRPECGVLFEYTWRTENETECLPHRRGTANARNNQKIREKAERLATRDLGVLDPEPLYTDSEAREKFRRVGLEPTVPYLGYREPQPSRCVYCSTAHHATLEQVTAHTGTPGYVRRFCSCTKKRREVER